MSFSLLPHSETLRWSKQAAVESASSLVSAYIKAGSGQLRATRLSGDQGPRFPPVHFPDCEDSLMSQPIVFQSLLFALSSVRKRKKNEALSAATLLMALYPEHGRCRTDCVHQDIPCTVLWP